ncbi:MAG: DEAD/DEAH box helicase [Actinomycetota bacterium]
MYLDFVNEPFEDLPTGLYDQIISEALNGRLAGIDRGLVIRAPLDPVDADVVLVRYVADAFRRALRSVQGEGETRLVAQVTFCNEILAHLSRSVPQGVNQPGDRVARTNDRLLALLEQAEPPAAPRRPARPEVPLSVAALLVNGVNQPRIGAEVVRELESADSVDLLSAFIKWHGLRIVEGQLRALCQRGGRLRIITTTYMGATDRRALDALVGLGAEVRVSYETRTTRLHAKAWIFHRNSGYSTAYVGSSNLSRSAMVDGLEWNVRLAKSEQPDLHEVCAATFANYWSDPSFETYEPERDGPRFDKAVAAERGGGVDLPIQISALEVHPWAYQSEMLARLESERVNHDRWRNLVVAATGTGKTVIAALDYQRLKGAGKVDRLLFVAHREEILRQSLSTFRHVLRDGAFGEVLVAGQRPSEWRHVFASVQSLARMDLSRDLPADRFDMVIVDEFHHAEAATYTKLLNHLRPTVLLGLTATPERVDGGDVTAWFGGRIAVELRLWEALDRGLLCPFQYFGVHDDVDLSGVPWRRGLGYDPTVLSNVYTAHDGRARKIAQAVLDKVGDVSSMRALGFCVSIDHAEFMAARFNTLGIPSTAVSARSGRDERLNALRNLRDGSIKAIFAVDLFNEGVDVPEIDTVLFLRPTESPTVFLQQLGRGLRLSDNKACLTVLDFIGNQNAAFRFDLRYRALTGVSRRALEREVEQGFPSLPAGCHLELDRVAASIVLENVRRALHLRWRDLVAELRRLGDVGLTAFLAETGLEPEDLYRSRKGGWTQLRRDAGLEQRPPGAEDDRLALAIGRLWHVDDRERLRAYAQAIRGSGSLPAQGRSGRLLAMLHRSLWGPNRSADEMADDLARVQHNEARRDEILEVLGVAGDRLERVTTPADPAGRRPLHVHAHYRLAEALSAFGMTNPSSMRQGVCYVEGERADAFFVTLRKTERHYSPTTRYQDYAISPTLFHWESQSTTTSRSPTGQRYMHHAQEGTTVHLFVRESKESDGLLGPSAYLDAGPMRYLRHEGERPMCIVWRLEHALPGEVFHLAKVASG